MDNVKEDMEKKISFPTTFDQHTKQHRVETSGSSLIVTFTARSVAQRGIAISCLSARLSVRLSVTLVDCDHMRCNSSEITSQMISLTFLLSADPNITDLLLREHPQILARIKVG